MVGGSTKADKSTGTKSACWGGLMSTAAQKKGILGVVIDGACRDLAEHRALDFPVSHSTETTSHISSARMRRTAGIQDGPTLTQDTGVCTLSLDTRSRWIHPSLGTAMSPHYQTPRAQLGTSIPRYSGRTRVYHGSRPRRSGDF